MKENTTLISHDSTMADPELDAAVPPGLLLVSAFLAMEPTDFLICLARGCDGGLVTERVQRFIWVHCICNKAIGKGYAPYLKSFIKKLIFEVESSNGTVLDELYEQCGYYMTSFKDDSLDKRGARVCKCISFLFPEGCYKSTKLVVPLHCSLNMLEGDTGCSVWPSSVYLSEFVLSFPDIFSNKSCFEIGSGVGLVGICLSHVKACKVILSDGDLSTLANMKLNLELNQLSIETDVPERSSEVLNMQEKSEVQNKSEVKCIHLPWESATETELREFMPDIILGADIIYDPSCLPHLVRVLAILWNQRKTHSESWKETWRGLSVDNKQISVDVNSAEGKVRHACESDKSEHNIHENIPSIDPSRDEDLGNGTSNTASNKGPVAYIASVIRNIETFSYFQELAEQANLTIRDVTKTLKPLDFLPYMQTYNRSSVQLFTVTCK